MIMLVVSTRLLEENYSHQAKYLDSSSVLDDALPWVNLDLPGGSTDLSQFGTR